MRETKRFFEIMSELDEVLHVPPEAIGCELYPVQPAGLGRSWTLPQQPFLQL